MKLLDTIKKEYGPTTVALLKKQCSIIKVDYKAINFADSNWQNEYSWTQKQKDNYRKWFINYLYGNLKRTKEIARFAYLTYRNKRRLETVWHWWNLDYGWKRSDYEITKK